MKKALILATILGSLLPAIMPAFGAYAVDSQSHDVTVGEVDETIYSVDIYWGGDLAFDWKYDEETNSHDFRAKKSCFAMRGDVAYQGDWYGMGVQNYLSAAKGASLVYSDSECTNVYYGDIDPDTMYYSRIGVDGQIIVTDRSTNGSLSATMSFTPEENYNWVVGKTASIASVTTDGRVHYYNDPDDVPSNELWQRNRFENPIFLIQDYFYLEKAPDTDLSTKTVSANDKIGTLAINLTPAGE